MLVTINNLIKKNREAIILILFLFALMIIINSSFLLPIIISILLSYFLYNVKKILIRLGCPQSLSFSLTYFIFIAVFSLISLLILPRAFKKILEILNDVPCMIYNIKFSTNKFIRQYPAIFPPEMSSLVSNAVTYIQSIGKAIISASLLSIVIITRWTLYIFFIPVIVFFLLKDYIKIVIWFEKITPKHSYFWKKIWYAIRKQISNYIIGKFAEFLIVTLASYILFKSYKLSYPDLMAVCVGMSVIMPYIGTIIVSIPIILISAIQLGLTHDLLYFNLIYITIQFLDGNILVPVLFSEVVDLHPLSIIIAIIIFGSTMNMYGLVFAIPFAIVIKAIINLYFMPIDKLNVEMKRKS